MPEAHAGENLRRSDLLYSGSAAEQTLELLKLLVFQASNNLLSDASSQTWNNFKTFFTVCGDNLPLLDRSVLGDPTMQSFLEKAFEKALCETVPLRKWHRLRSVDDDEDDRMSRKLVQWALACGHNPNVHVAFFTGEGTSALTPLQIAILAGDIALVQLLLQYKADVDLCTKSCPLTPLQLALGDRPPWATVDAVFPATIINDLLAAHAPFTTVLK